MKSIIFKSVFAVFLVVCLALFASACGPNGIFSEGGQGTQTPSVQPEEPDIPNNPDLPEEQPGDDEHEKETEMYLHINGNALTISLADTDAARALASLLQESDIVYTARDYGGFEKVGSLGHTLPAEDSRIAAEPGDVMLYQGGQIVIFYGSNTWSYTRLGRIEGYSPAELAALLGTGDMQVRLSLQED